MLISGIEAGGNISMEEAREVVAGLFEDHTRDQFATFAQKINKPEVLDGGSAHTIITSIESSVRSRNIMQGEKGNYNLLLSAINNNRDAIQSNLLTVLIKSKSAAY